MGEIIIEREVFGGVAETPLDHWIEDQSSRDPNKNSPIDHFPLIIYMSEILLSQMVEVFSLLL